MSLAFAGCQPGPDTLDIDRDQEEANDPAAPAGDKDNGAPNAPAADAASGPPYPIVLLHGMGGFVKTTGPMPMTYFRGIVEDLAAEGEEVHTTLAAPFATSEVRAVSLKDQLEEIRKKTGKAKVNIVGHSQGGIDARVIASPGGLQYGDHIASITTIATPHRGSALADQLLEAMNRVPGGIVDRLTETTLTLFQKSFYEVQNDPELRAQLEFVSEKHMTGEFNAKYVNHDAVTYWSYAGRSNGQTGEGVCDDGELPNDPTVTDKAQLSLVRMGQMLTATGSKANDGVVTVESSKWGKFVQCLPADHLKEVGHPSRPFDHLAFFRSLVTRIRSAGL